MSQDPEGDIQRGAQVVRHVAGAAGDAIQEYLVYRPRPDSGGAPFPVLLFLHGRGEARVNEGVYQGVAALMLHGSPPWRCHEEGWSQPFIIVSPQLPDRQSRWHTVANISAVENILSNVIGWYQGDETRVCATGFSIGGLGVVALAAQGKRRYARLLPVDAADPDPVWKERKVTNQASQGTPTWGFHRAENQGGPGLATLLDPAAKQTVIHVKHTAVCRWAYAHAEVYKWLLGD